MPDTLSTLLAAWAERAPDEIRHSHYQTGLSYWDLNVPCGDAVTSVYYVSVPEDDRPASFANRARLLLHALECMERAGVDPGVSCQSAYCQTKGLGARPAWYAEAFVGRQHVVTEAPDSLTAVLALRVALLKPTQK